jgi:hypothetical protein
VAIQSAVVGTCEPERCPTTLPVIAGMGIGSAAAAGDDDVTPGSTPAVPTAATAPAISTRRKVPELI